MNHKFVCSYAFTEFKEVFENLDMRLKLCFLSFAVLPEDVVVKRRLLINWCVGEGLEDPPSTEEKRAEDVADEILKELELKGFIEPVKERCKLNRVCLVKDEDGTLEQILKNSPNSDQEKLQTIFSVNESFPDLRFEWEGSLENQIEVESTEFLKGLKIMKCLRLLCLQGISRIEEFPNSIGKITNLRILDLKACHNLEALPDGIALLKKLSHRDIQNVTCFVCPRR
nr:putative disease resistance protein rga4 [Quercus suber]